MKNILIVEDHRQVADLLRHVLSGAGYGADTAFDVSEALRKMGSALPDLIMLDVGLPGVSGLQFLESLKQSPKTAAIPVVMCTDKGLMGDIEKACRGGAQGYIVKPFDPERVVKKVRELLGE